METTNKEEKLYDRFLIFIDSLEIATVSIDPEVRFNYKFIVDNYKEVDSINNEKVHRVTEDIYLIRKFTKIKGYTNNYEIIIDGISIANFLFHHRKDDPIIKIKLHNKVLYEEQYLDYVKKILYTFSLNYHYTSYLEISYDSDADTTKRFADYYFSSNKFEYATEKKFKHKSNSVINAIENAKTFVIGKSEAKKFVLYNKSKEIDHSEKEYIRKIHEDNGLTGQVHRVEARLSRKFLKNYDYDLGFLLKLDDANFIKSLFVTSVANNLTFVDLLNYVYLSRNKKCKERQVINLKKVSQKTLAPIKKTNTINLDKDRSYDKMLREIVKEIRKHEPSDNLDLLTTSFKNNYYREMLQKVKKAVRKHASVTDLTTDSCKEHDYLNNPAYHAKQIFSKKNIGDIYCPSVGKQDATEQDHFLSDNVVDVETMPMPTIKSIDHTLF